MPSRGRVVGKCHDFPMVQSPMRNSCGTKKIIPKLNNIVVIIDFSLSKASGAFRDRRAEASPSYLHNTSEVSFLPPEVQCVQGYRHIDMPWKIMSIGMRMAPMINGTWYKSNAVPGAQTKAPRKPGRCQNSTGQCLRQQPWSARPPGACWNLRWGSTEPSSPPESRARGRRGGARSPGSRR
jgi:hypothetical protein